MVATYAPSVEHVKIGEKIVHHRDSPFYLFRMCLLSTYSASSTQGGIDATVNKTGNTSRHEQGTRKQEKDTENKQNNQCTKHQGHW